VLSNTRASRTAFGLYFKTFKNAVGFRSRRDGLRRLDLRNLGEYCFGNKKEDKGDHHGNSVLQNRFRRSCFRIRWVRFMNSS